MRTKVSPDAALIVVDVQNGFISEKNELPIAEGEQVVPVINRVLPRFRVRVGTQDWHPPGHGSFASGHPGREPFERGELDGLPQIFWPDHCVQGTRGAELHPGLDQKWLRAIFRKAMDPKTDSYSAFADNAGRNPTGLDGYLKAQGVRQLFLSGLALDYCVLYSARDARKRLPGVDLFVILDATRPVDPKTGDEARKELGEMGVRLVREADLDFGDVPEDPGAGAGPRASPSGR